MQSNVVGLDVAQLRPRSRRPTRRFRCEPDRDSSSRPAGVGGGSRLSGRICSRAFPRRHASRSPASPTRSRSARLAPGERRARPRLRRRHGQPRRRPDGRPEGSVTGIDMTPAMLERARRAADELGATNVRFVEGEAERSRSTTRRFDVVISNGVIDLIPDKDAVFGELYRVLRPGGRMQLADVTIQRPVSEEGTTQHRPLDRLNCRSSAGSRVRRPARAPRLRAHRDRQPDRHLRALLVRRHAREGASFGAHGTTVKAFKPLA